METQDIKNDNEGHNKRDSDRKMKFIKEEIFNNNRIEIHVNNKMRESQETSNMFFKHNVEWG